MKIAILSDIHANLSALNAVLAQIERYKVDSMIFLGDLINYGMRPNEVITTMKKIKIPILAKLCGNHENALMDNDLTKFSTDRGRAILEFTRQVLSQDSKDYIANELIQAGRTELTIDNRKFLLVHGNIDDFYWGKLGIAQMEDERFARYDYILSGHSHICHYMEVFFRTDAPNMRNKKKTVFINPGSVGQPRNLNACAQFGILDTETTSYQHIGVPYNVEYEQSLYTKEVDEFYKNRLSRGV